MEAKYHVGYVRSIEGESWRTWAWSGDTCIYATDANSLSHAVALAEEHKGDKIEWRWDDSFQAGEGQ